MLQSSSPMLRDRNPPLGGPDDPSQSTYNHLCFRSGSNSFHSASSGMSSGRDPFVPLTGLIAHGSIVSLKAPLRRQARLARKLGNASMGRTEMRGECSTACSNCCARMYDSAVPVTRSSVPQPRKAPNWIVMHQVAAQYHCTVTV